MMVVMRKTYTISVTIQEGSDEFWEALRGKSGCDEVIQMVREALAERGFGHADDGGSHVRLERFEERAPIAFQ